MQKISLLGLLLFLGGCSSIRTIAGDPLVQALGRNVAITAVAAHCQTRQQECRVLADRLEKYLPALRGNIPTVPKEQ